MVYTKARYPYLGWLAAPPQHTASAPMGGNFRCNPGWFHDRVSVLAEAAPTLLDFVANVHLHPFIHGMQGPTWVSAQGFGPRSKGALDFFLCRTTAHGVGGVTVERETFFLSNHYLVHSKLSMFSTLPATDKNLARASFKLGTGVFEQQRQLSA